jgi:hypothetical protein
MRRTGSQRRTPRWPIALLVMALAAGAARASEEPFTVAMLRYERNQWAAAYAALTALADQGHPEAARIAWQMWRYGPQLYGTEFAATTRQLERWAQWWRCGGDATVAGCTQALRAP